MNNLKERNMASTILLYIFTLGIYAIYLYFALGYEIRYASMTQETQTKPKGPWAAYFLGIITLGIYFLFWRYNQAKALEEMGNSVNYKGFTPGTIVLFTFFFGISIFLLSYDASNIAILAKAKNKA